MSGAWRTRAGAKRFRDAKWRREPSARPLPWRCGNGGADSLARSRLWAKIPDLLGRYRELARSRASRRDRSLRCGCFWSRSPESGSSLRSAMTSA